MEACGVEQANGLAPPQAIRGGGLGACRARRWRARRRRPARDGRNSIVLASISVVTASIGRQEADRLSFDGQTDGSSTEKTKIEEQKRRRFRTHVIAESGMCQSLWPGREFPLGSDP